MEKFVVSALKYRPQSFKDVVGQVAITKTLEKAIKDNRLAKALLFTGPRGVGKTTCARILAKMINTKGKNDPNQDYSFNIFELDAASNNSVDDIRNLTDQVRIPPQVGNYKVYIIDEVHMLSTNAFNAFLKTLEEPPEHCIFILATTEKHKIIPTILSRCQIFDFKRISTNDVKNYLKIIANEQGIDTDNDALNIIAQKSDGSMRDALSTFDRVVSFCGKELTRKAVSENLNVLDHDIFFECTELMLKNDIPSLLLTFDKIIQKGFEGQHFISGLASHFRDLLISKNVKTIILLETSPTTRENYKLQSDKTDIEFLKTAVKLANECDFKYRDSRNKRLLIEICLMQLASINFDGEKKKFKHFIIPASHFGNNLSKIIETEESKMVLTKNSNYSNITITNNKIGAEKNNEIEFQNNNSVKPKIELKNYTSSGLSLKSIKRKKDHQIKLMDVAINPADLPKKSFNHEQLIKTWNDYVNIIEDQGRHNLAAILKIDEPKISDDNLILLELSNSTNKIELKEEKNELIEYLRKSLENYEIDLEISINESIEKKFIYTNEEKYEKLKEKNQSLELLRKTFNLDL